eukprot:CAMPEP_0202974224 /NCGR_PEP_ID=MMETSP1396-20130829/58600_1 /ASSEMBLY_ACC=CAM_ASM_000872 /TAXON_ID= /ORGANISM="Pseudokeronopsis sp., Strain Brazil" /LENGTH=117 /DNA_ID=CAMNT_0049707683 /DNA_START=269 /DNA_END=622 /DNA_ORIENTATION=-
MFSRYLNKPEATREVLSEDGWYSTGDYGLFDKKVNSYKILGRMSADIIKKGGYKLSALEIEGVLLKNPKVSEACVFGVNDEKYQEEIFAYVVPSDKSLTIEELKEFAKRNLPKYQVP